MYDIEENIIKEDLNEKLIKPVILRKVENERLYQDKDQNLYYKLPCLGDKYLAAEKGALERINGIVLHRTASGKMQKTKDILDGLKKNGTHFLIDRDGTIYQAASLLNATQHVGPIRAKFKIDKNLVKSKDYHNGYDDLWKDGQAVPIWTNSTEYNQRRIGVFFRESYKPYPHRYVYNRDSIGIEVVASYDSNPKKQTSPLWESTTKEQLASIRHLVNLLKSLYNLSDEDVYKHNVIAYKTDNEADELYEPQNHY